MRQHENVGEHSSLVEHNLAQSGPSLREASDAAERLRATGKALEASLSQLDHKLREHPTPGSALAHVDHRAARSLVEEMRGLLRSAEDSFRRAEIDSVSSRNQMTSATGNLNRPVAEGLKSEQAFLLKEYAKDRESRARMETIRLETAIYKGSGADEANRIVGDFAAASAVSAAKYSSQLEQLGVSMRALADAPTINSTHQNTIVDKAGTIVIRGDFGESGSVDVRWEDKSGVRVDYTVGEHTTQWRAVSYGTHQPAEGGTIVTGKSDQFSLAVQQAGTVKRHESDFKHGTTTKDRGIDLTEVGAKASSSKSREEEKVEKNLEFHVKGHLTISPEKASQNTVTQQTTTEEELSRNTRVVSFRVETHSDGLPLRIERQGYSRNQ